jgi:hypothetical protein
MVSIYGTVCFYTGVDSSRDEQTGFQVNYSLALGPGLKAISETPHGHHHF